MVDKMKVISDTLLFATCKNGDLHLNVESNSLLLGTLLKELAVYPQGIAVNHHPNRHLPAEMQLEASLQANEAITVQLLQKHFSRALVVSQLISPSQILCGISGGQSPLVHLMFVFRDPSDVNQVILILAVLVPSLTNLIASLKSFD